jgi:hypothetical protein
MKKFKYKVIKNAIDIDLANFIYNYFLVKRDAVKHMYENNMHEQWNILGHWDEKQVPGTYCCYGDFASETLLLKMMSTVEKHSGLTLVPTYSFTRLYKKGDVLVRHKDRTACELSTSINLGGDPWPIFIDEPGALKGTEIILSPGDMLVYAGCDLEHWREEFKGEICGQVFLHYANKKNIISNELKFDRRAMLGLPY